MLTHTILPIWAFGASAYLILHTCKKYYNVIVMKDNFDRQPDISDTLKKLFNWICKGYVIWLIL